MIGIDFYEGRFLQELIEMRSRTRTTTCSALEQKMSLLHISKWKIALSIESKRLLDLEQASGTFMCNEFDKRLHNFTIECWLYNHACHAPH